MKKLTFLTLISLGLLIRGQSTTLPSSHRGIEPPAFNVRTMAEWEELQALCITWTDYTSTLKEIVRHAVKETKVIIVCDNASSVQSTLENDQIPTNNIEFIETGYNTLWIRDYGPNTVYKNDVDSIYFVDWTYNRPRPADDIIPTAIGNRLNIQLFETTTGDNKLVATGGNFMADGMGKGFSSHLITEENSGKSEAQINNIMKSYMGIDEYVLMTVLPYDDIHHIDMHMKLLDEETLLVGKYPDGVADGPQIEANLQYVLSNYKTPWDTPYRIIRIPMPSDGGYYPDNFGAYRTYANAVFVNKTVLVPSYEEQYDTTAKRIWQEALPGYKIQMIDCNSVIQAGGAIHCITHEVGVNDPLYISHQPLRGTVTTNGDYTLSATIKHRSGIQEAQIYYSVNGGSFQPLAMSSSGDTFTANIPAQADGSTIRYYIRGTAQSGKSINRPMPAPDGYWEFKTSGSATSLADDFSSEMQAIYPNPAKAITCIPLRLTNSMEGSLELLDVHGRVVETIAKGTFASGEKNYFIHAQNYPSGMYMVRFESSSTSMTQKLMIE